MAGVGNYFCFYNLLPFGIKKHKLFTMSKMLGNLISFTSNCNSFHNQYASFILILYDIQAYSAFYT